MKFLQLFLSIFFSFPPSCSLLLELIFTDMKTLWCIFHTLFLSIFPDFFFFLHIYRVPPLWLQINNSVLIHAKLLFNPSIKIYLHNFQNLFWFSATFSMKLWLIIATGSWILVKYILHFFFFEVFFWILSEVSCSFFHLNPLPSLFSSIVCLFTLAYKRLLLALSEVVRICFPEWCLP